MTDWYAANQILIQTTLVYAFVALSIQVVLRSGVFSLASVGCFGISGYVAAALTIRSVSGPLAFVAGVAAAGAVAYLLSRVVTGLRSMHLALVTVAFTMILSVVAINGGALTGGPLGLYGVPATISIPVMLGLLIITVLIVRRLEISSLGRSFAVLRLNEDLARSVGIDVDARRRLVFCTSGILGGIAGVMNVYVFTVINPQTAGFKMVMLGLTMVVIGGVSRWPGAIIGAVFVAWLPILLGGFSDYEPMIYGLLVVGLVVLAPGGVIGAIDSAMLRLRSRRSAGPVDPAAHDSTSDLRHDGGGITVDEVSDK